MSGTKVWNTGEVLTASDLNGNFDKLPFASAAFSFIYFPSIAPNDAVTVAVALPVGRFTLSPIVVVSASDQFLTAYISALSTGTATIGLRNNGNSASGGASVLGFAVQMTASSPVG